MIHFIRSYLRFLYHSKNEHGVHSPFVFDLVTKCFYDFSKKEAYSKLKAHRNAVLNNNTVITVTDFGTGSRVFKSNDRTVSAIAKIAGISVKRAQLLYRLVAYFKPESILEIGTSVGLAAVAMALGNPKNTLTTVEGCEETSKSAQKHFKELKGCTINPVVSTFESFLSDPSHLSDYDLIYFDGNHSKSATLDYFEMLLEHKKNTSVWIFDDIHWSKDMEEAWEVIKTNPHVRVSIDTYQWGIVFFRTEQKEKEHFIIRM